MTGSHLLRRSLGTLGAAATPALLALQRRRDQAVVLLYHRVSPHHDLAYSPLEPTVLAEHLELIRRNLDVVPLRSILDDIQEGRPLAGRCAITFDDGYRDFLDHAYPVIERARIPVTHFVVSNCVASGLPTWTYRVNHLGLRATTCAVDWIDEKARLGRMEPVERDAWITQEEARHGIDHHGLMLRADDLPRCDPQLVDWQSHGVSHTLAGALGEEAFADELERSRVAIEGWTGRPVDLFSFPNGERTDVAGAVLERSSYRAAVVVGEKPVRPATSLTAVPRFDVGRYPTSWLALAMAGTLETVRGLRR